MKPIILFALLLSLVGCTTSNPSIPKTDQTQVDTQIIESTILWIAEVDEVTWEPIELAKLLKDGNRFKAEGNFYKVLDDTQAFGAKVSYIGLLGINFALGPNATLLSDPESVAKYISQKYGVIFTPEPEENAFVAELGEDLQLVIVAHPSVEGSSMIIGEYTGL